MERGQDKARKAQHEEMQGARRSAAAEIDKQANGQVNGTVGIEVQKSRIALCRSDDDVVLDLFPTAVVQDRILRRSPCAQPGQNLGGLKRILNLNAFNRNQNIAGVKSGLGARAAGLNPESNYANGVTRRLIDPDHAIIGEMILILLIEIEPRGNDSRDSHDHQQGADEL